MTDEKKTKKGFFAAIKESMIKTGGCCGPGEDCCGPSQQEKKEKSTEEKKDTNSEKCCNS